MADGKGADTVGADAARTVTAVATTTNAARTSFTMRLREETGVLFETEFLQGFVRAAVPLRDEDVAGELQIGNAGLARPEAGRDQVAEAAEERDAVREFG